MEELNFIPAHPLHIFAEEDRIDYSERNEYFIQCVKAMENIMDLDAYIIDYIGGKVLYATKGYSSLQGYTYKELESNYIFSEDLPTVATLDWQVFDFFYSLPKHRRLNCYLTSHYRIRNSKNKVALINHKCSVLDLAPSGTMRLTLCIDSCPTSDKSGAAYIKMADTNTVYEFLKSSQKFVEVKTQKLTNKMDLIVKLASNGRTEMQIAEELGISVNTVKYHKKQIFTRLGVKNITEAVQWVNNQKKLVKG